MADITVRNQGEVSDEGLVNWRGDQVSVTPGGQSVFDTASVQMADLGSRKVVGDRVFRYTLAAGTIAAGDLAQLNPASLINVTAGGTNPAGGKVFTFYFATSNSANVFAEGTLHSQSGTAANTGYTYRVKSQPIVATTSTANLVLYDPLKIAANVTDKWSLHKNMYSGITVNTAGTAAPAGVVPVAVVSGDYFWLQTWGPVAVRGSAASAAGLPLIAGATGAVGAFSQSNTVAGAHFIGYSLQIITASEKGMVFLQIAP